MENKEDEEFGVLLDHNASERGELLQRRVTDQDRGNISLTGTEEMQGFIKSDEFINALPKKTVRKFYRRQNEIIEGLREISMAFQAEGPTEDNKELAKKIQCIVSLSFFCNIALFALKIAIAIKTGSLAVVASTIDSLLDLLSGSVLFFVSRFINKSEPYKYPEGKVRAEPLGIIIFAAIMGMTSLNILKEAGQSLITGLLEEPSEPDVGVLSIAGLCSVIVVKSGLYAYCRKLRDQSGIVEALGEDHFNDVCTNIVASVAAVLAGEFMFLWWFDPAGAGFFGVWILVSWIQQGRERIGMLVGDAAPPQLIGQLAFMAGHHDPRITRVDTVRAFHFGERYLCEVDIVLPETMSLKESHDIGEALQFKLEKLPTIQRAYVHLDYEWQHRPEH